MTLMQSIYKYKIVLDENQVIRVPQNAKVLSVGLDPSNTLCLWCQVSRTEMVTKDLFVSVVGTGFDVRDDAGTFIGTVRQGVYMWHVFVK